ncbi:MAG: hypothetical protein QXM43_05605 [Desulfurococcaceae archaeon]
MTVDSNTDRCGYSTPRGPLIPILRGIENYSLAQLSMINTVLVAKVESN